jgi:hypothetical protein
VKKVSTACDERWDRERRKSSIFQFARRDESALVREVKLLFNLNAEMENY